MDERCQWIEHDHIFLSVHQQADIPNLQRSGIYYKPRQKILNEGQLGLLQLIDEVYTKYSYMGTRQMSDYISMHHYPCKRHEARWEYEQLGLRSVAPGPIYQQATPRT